MLANKAGPKEGTRKQDILIFWYKLAQQSKTGTKIDRFDKKRGGGSV